MSRYAAARIYALPDSLDELVGPTSGIVTLPRHIDWGPHCAYDLADEADLLLMYERVLREAQSPADLCAHLNADLLRRHWTDLFLPAPVREAWQTRFPQLAPAAAAAQWTSCTADSSASGSTHSPTTSDTPSQAARPFKPIRS